MKTGFIKRCAALCVGAVLTVLAASGADVFGPFGSSDDWTYEAGNQDKGATPVIGMSGSVLVGGESAAAGDCVAAYRTDKNVICGLGRVTESGMLGIKFEVNTGVRVHFKLWVASSGLANPTIYDVDSSCDFTIPTTDAPTVDMGSLFVIVPKTFAPGLASSFVVLGSERATVVGVSGLSWGDFSSKDYYGTTTFVDANIVDAEKTSAANNDDYWCGPMADIDALFLAGWGAKTSYANVDALVEYFRKNPKKLRYEKTPGNMNSVTEGDYGYDGIFMRKDDNWFKDETGIDLTQDVVGCVTWGQVDRNFPATLRNLMSDGNHVVRLDVLFEPATKNKKWKGRSVSHAVLCVGYALDESRPDSDPAKLKALFIIDPDNDQYTGTGGTKAPNSIMYCPVTWAYGEYMVSGVWGEDSTLLSDYTALAVYGTVPMRTTVTFNANGGTGTMVQQKFAPEESKPLTFNTFERRGYLFAGWKDPNGVSYEDGQTVSPQIDLTLTAQWEEIYVRGESDSDAFEWRGGAGTVDVSCNTGWTATTSDAWITFTAAVAGDGDGTVDFAVAPNTAVGTSRTGAITIKSTDGSRETRIRVVQSARPAAPVWTITDGVLSAVDMNGYATASLPSSVRVIAAETFAGCDTLTKVTVPASVTTIGGGAFADCPNLKEVVFEGNAPEIDMTECARELFEGTPETLVVSVRDGTTGWMTAQSSEMPETWPVGDSSARTVNVVYNYVISFDWNGWNGGETIEDIVVEPGETVQRLPYFSNPRPGYYFLGWLDEDGTELRSSDGYTPVSSVVLRANWSPRRYTFTFDGNGGQPTRHKIELQCFDSEWASESYQKLPTDPVRKGYQFDGWWTEKNGGEAVPLDGVCTYAGDRTFYAHWLRTTKVTVKGGTVAEEDGDSAMSLTILQGTELYIEADDKSAENKVFSHWSWAPADVDLGETFKPRDAFTPMVVPAKDVTLTANYIASPGYAEIAVDVLNLTKNDDDDEAVSAVEWSTDGKVWTAVDGVAYPVKTGRTTFQFRSNDPRWTVQTRVTATVAKGESAVVIVTATRVSVVDAVAFLEQETALGSVTVNPKNGQALNGKAVTLSAKAGKDSVFAYWVDANGEIVGYSSTLKILPDADTACKAVFREKSAVEAPSLDTDDYYENGLAMVGVEYSSCVFLYEAQRPVKFTARNLPQGLKINADSGEITGVPTKAGTYAVQITATSQAVRGGSASITVPVQVAALPVWAQGEFTGKISFENGETYENGPMTMTVSSVGKISGKLALGGTNYNLTAVSYESVWETGVDGTNLWFVAACKAGKDNRTFTGYVRAPVPSNTSYVGGSTAGGWLEDIKSSWAEMGRNVWKDSDALAALSDFVGTYTANISALAYDWGTGYLSLTLDKKGSLKASGKLPDGTALSGTATAVPAGDGLKAVFYVKPSVYKGGAFFAEICISEYRKLYSSDSDWFSLNPQATSAYGAGFRDSPYVLGAWYNKLDDLRTYYSSLTFGADAPNLRATVKTTDYDEKGKKKTVSEEIEIGPALGAYVTVEVNGKGTAFVVPKATKPVQDRETKEWLYEGENDCAVSLSFTKATGIFKGSFTCWYDYMSAYDATTDKETLSHTSKKVSFEGIAVLDDDPAMRGFYLWDATGVYNDEKTGREKTYKYKESYPVFMMK